MMIELFINQKPVDKELLKYSAGQVYFDDKNYCLHLTQQGAKPTLSIGQPVYDEQGNLLGHLEIRVAESLDYTKESCLEKCKEFIPTHCWCIGKRTKHCVHGKKVITYWQKKAGG